MSCLAAGLTGCGALNGGNAPSPLCGNDGTDKFALNGVDQIFSPPLVPTNGYISGGAANFDWDHEVNDLCSLGPDSNNYVTFSASINAAASDFVFTGRVFTAALFQPYTSPIPGGPTEFIGSVNNIGLKQSHPNGDPATIVVELHLSFNSSGDINADQARAKSLLRSISILTNFSHPKS